jgi:hypothetical protein
MNFLIQNLLNILNYQIVLILTKVLTGNFLLLLLYLGYTTDQCSTPFGHLHYLLVLGLQGPLLFSGDFRAQEVDGIGGKGSGVTTTVDV